MTLSLILRGATNSTAFQNSIRLTPSILRNCHPICNSASLSHLSCPTPILGKSNPVPKLQIVQARNAHIDHGILWKVEKVWAASLLAIIPLTVLSPSPLMDNIFVVTTVIHNHWGLEACVIDYVRPVIFGNFIPKVALGMLYAFSAVLLGGLLYFNFNDIGVGRAVRKFWSITKE